MEPIQENEHAIIGALDEVECLILLRWEVVGRLAFADPGEAPIVVPVNFVMDGGTIVFRTDAGEKHDRVVGRRVSFQVDRVDHFRRVGWSVLVQGVAEEIPMDGARELGVDPWAPGDKSCAVRIIPASITGRTILPNRSPLDGRAYL